MVPQPLVPAKHYALPWLKKNTHHYLNMAPLWEELVPLMTAIDQGLKQAQMALEANGPIVYDDLNIYTKVTPSTPAYKHPETWFNMLLFEGNVWYKLIYRVGIQSAVLIIIHNTPENPPPNKCLIGKRRECSFEMWSNVEEIRERISPNIKRYANCCKVTASDVSGIFSRDYITDIDGYLEIDTLITKGEDHISNSKLKKVLSWPWRKFSK